MLLKSVTVLSSIGKEFTIVDAGETIEIYTKNNTLVADIQLTTDMQDVGRRVHNVIEDFAGTYGDVQEYVNIVKLMENKI